MLALAEVAEPIRDPKLEFEFRRRAQRDLEKPNEISCSTSAASLSNVRSDRDCSTPQLLTKAVAFMYRKGMRETIDIERKLLGLSEHA
jgi:hypothetical protein